MEKKKRLWPVSLLIVNYNNYQQLIKNRLNGYLIQIGIFYPTVNDLLISNYSMDK